MFALENTPFDPAKLSELMGGSDFAKMFEMPELGAFDQSALLETQRKNVEAFSAAQQVATAGYQTVFEKQITMMQDTLNGAQSQIAELSKSSTATDAATKQTDLMKATYEAAVANVNELSELTQKANADAFAVIRDRMEASLKELKAL